MNDLLTVEEVADYLRMAKCTIYSWISRKRIPVVHIGYAVRIRREDVMKLLTEIPADPDALDKQYGRNGQVYDARGGFKNKENRTIIVSEN